MKKEEYKVSGDDVVRKVKELIKKGNVNKIIIKNEKGEVVIEFPITVGVVGAVVALPLVALGAMAALLTNCTIVVEKK